MQPIAAPKRRVPVVAEAEIQQTIVEILQVNGYGVLETNRGSSNWETKLYASAGVPDVLTRHPRWPDCVILGLEVKKEDGKPTPEQQALIDANWYPIVRSPEGALAAVRDFERERNLVQK